MLAFNSANWRPIGLLAVSLVVLAACGGGGKGIKQGIDTLGPVFVRAFNQGPNDAPLDISNANLSVDLTGEPFEL